MCTHARKIETSALAPTCQACLRQSVDTDRTFPTNGKFGHKDINISDFHRHTHNDSFPSRILSLPIAITSITVSLQRYMHPGRHRGSSLRLSIITLMLPSILLSPGNALLSLRLSPSIALSLASRSSRGICRHSPRPYSTTTTTALPMTSCHHALWDRSTLLHDVCVLRHGQSQANVQGLIASDPSIANHQFGLSQVGQEQARQAGKDVVAFYQREGGNHYHGVCLLSSDLLRAKETAQAVHDALVEHHIPLVRHHVIIEAGLRERWFGAWDMSSDENYQRVWKDDALDSSHTHHGVESVDSVMTRATQVVVDYHDALPEDSKHLIICVAHGDVLQILQTAFAKMDGRHHRTLPHLETATLRPLALTGTPPPLPP